MDSKSLIERILGVLPDNLNHKIKKQSDSIQIINNIFWLFFDKFLRLGVGLFVGIWTARYLGPDQFGLLNYALAYVALFTAVATLGLNGIVVRDIVQDPSKTAITMGTSFLLSIMGGFTAFGLSIVTIKFVRPNDDLAKSIMVLLSLLMIFKATDVVRYWFESQVQSKYIVWMENTVVFTMAIVKLGLIMIGAPLIAFVWTIFVESILVAVGLMGIYVWRGGKFTAWRFQYSRAKALLKDSWPLVLSGLAIMIYMRIDQIMLGQMLDNESVGIYTAAVKISEVWYFIPMTIVASVFPSIIETKKKNETLYYQRLQKLFHGMVLLGLSVALPMTFLSDWVVTLLFGHAYHQSGPVLAVHIWAGLFVFLGVASGKWFILEGIQKYTFYRTLLGAVVNVGMNLLMIPKFGIIGAAYATVISYAIAAMFSDALQEETRPLFKMKLKAFNLLSIARFIHR